MKNDQSSNYKSNIIVAIRVRPLLEYESKISNVKCVSVNESSSLQLITPVNFNPYEGKKYLNLENTKIKHYKYNFDYSFDEYSTQEEIYNLTASHLIPNILNGFNSTIFTFGTAGTGKTYTMFGNGEEPGIMIRTLNDLFNQLREKDLEFYYQIQLSYIEVYNENIYDLLSNNKKMIEILSDPQKGFFLTGMTKKKINNPIEGYKLLVQGNRNRKVGNNIYYDNSSRSHTILLIHIVKNIANNNLSNKLILNYIEETEFGKFILVDLAGGEKDKQFTKNSEGYYINKSLFALSNCMNSLVSLKNSNFIHWRDSKLTKILKDSLSGNSKIVMIANISPSIIAIKDTLFTIQFCENIKGIKINAKKNIASKPLHIIKYDNIINGLKLQIAKMKEEINIKNEEILNMSNSNKSNDLFDNSFEDERIIDISTHFQQEIAISKKIAQLEKNISSQKLGLITLENNPNKDNEQIIRIKNNLNETTKSLQTLYQQKSIMIQNRKIIQDIIIKSKDDNIINKLMTAYKYYISYIENLNTEYRAFVSENDLKRKDEEIISLENQLKLRDYLIKKVEDQLAIKHNMRLNKNNKKYISVDNLRQDPCLSSLSTKSIFQNDYHKTTKDENISLRKTPTSQRNYIVDLPILKKNVSQSVSESFCAQSSRKKKLNKNRSAKDIFNRPNNLKKKINFMPFINSNKRRQPSSMMEKIENKFQKKVKTILGKNILGRYDNSPFIKEVY
jgi:kinesin family protein 18/19